MFEPPFHASDRHAVAGRAPTTRSAIANRTRLHRDGDGRSASARRFRGLVQDLADPLGGFEGLGEADAALVREAAAKIIEAEALQSQLAHGERVNPEQSVRVSNVLARLLAQLERRRKALATSASPSPLAAHFNRPPSREGGA